MLLRLIARFMSRIRVNRVERRERDGLPFMVKRRRYCGGVVILAANRFLALARSGVQMFVRTRAWMAWEQHCIGLLIAGPLEIGLNAPLHVREERLSSCRNACRLMYVSDIHLRGGRSSHLAMQVVDAVRCCDANAVLLGGDLVDSSSELGSLRAMVAQLAGFGPVLAVGGNHDSRVGTRRVRDAVLNGGGAWIHEGSVDVRHRSRVITVFGPDFAAQPTGDVRVLCAHNPRIWKTSRRVGYDLVLAGHLHGCQFVAFEFRDRLYPGAVFYPYNWE